MKSPGEDVGTPPLRHLLLALATTAIWGANFVVIRIGLDQLPPLFFATLRFVFVFFPAALFVRPPKVSVRRLASYGVLIGGGQFGFLFLGMNAGVSPGLASVAIQSQALFSVVLAAGLAKERIRATQWAALAAGGLGLALIAWRGESEAAPIGLACILLAAFAWAITNFIVKGLSRQQVLPFIVWAAPFSVLPLAVLSICFEPSAWSLSAFARIGGAAWSAVLWQSAANTLFGYSVWSFLMARYQTARVAPFAFLVPVFGLASSALFLGEPLEPWKLAAAALVLGSLALNRV